MDLTEYLNISENIRKDFCRSLEQTCPDFSFRRFLNSRYLNIPVFIHRETGIEFCFIPSTSTKIGFDTEDEKKALKLTNPLPLTLNELRPSFQLNIKPFFISRGPFSNKDAAAINLIKKEGQNLSLPYFSKLDIAEKVAKKYNLSLPSEYQWECSCRATTSSLFCFGDKLLSQKDLAKWLSWNIVDEEKLNMNLFGLYGLFFGEWCADFYKKSHDQKAIKTKARVIKGGGAYFWPWQDQEWIWCLSAIRFPSSELPKKEAAFRLVKNIG